MPPVKQLIVNADDLGRSAGVNRGIMKAHRHGIVTSATLMVNAPRAAEAAAMARDHPHLGVGVHLVLTFGEPLSPAREVPSLVKRDGSFRTTAKQLAGKVHAEEALAEFRRQIDRATELLGKAPTHLDTHHFVQDDPEVLWALGEAAQERALAARAQSPAMRDDLRRRGVRTTDHFVVEFFGSDAGAYRPAAGRKRTRQDIGVAALAALLARLPDGTGELMCHPGDPDDELKGSAYYAERAIELATLTDPAIARAIRESGARLITYAEL